jgi:hypothetical protein
MVMSAMEAMLKLIKGLGKKTEGFSKQKISLSPCYKNPPGIA